MTDHPDQTPMRRFLWRDPRRGVCGRVYEIQEQGRVGDRHIDFRTTAVDDLEHWFEGLTTTEVVGRWYADRLAPADVL